MRSCCLGSMWSGWLQRCIASVSCGARCHVTSTTRVTVHVLGRVVMARAFFAVWQSSTSQLNTKTVCSPTTGIANDWKVSPCGTHNRVEVVGQGMC